MSNAAPENGEAGTVHFDEAQLADIAALLAQHVPRGNIGLIATSVLGPGALLAAGNDIGDVKAFARQVVRTLADAGRLGEALSLLRQEAHRNSPLTLGLSYILGGGRLSDAQELQRFVNDYEPFLRSADIHEVFPKVLRTVCAIALGDPRNEIVGSGFLIAPDLVMTNYHVIQEYLRQVNGVIVENGPGDQIFCFFDYLWEPQPRVPPNGEAFVTARAEGWLVHARPLLPGDGTEKCPQKVDTEFDYAVIRLSKPVGRRPARLSGGVLRGWLSLRDRVNALDEEQRIIVFQHPQAAPQRWDLGTFVQMDPSRTRVWYSVSTAHGSSGGAAVDRKGRLFALHNAEVDRPDIKEKLNQGVRIDKIAGDLATWVENWSPPPSPEEDPLAFWSLSDDRGDPQPVLGRTAFREAVATMAASGGGRVAVVTGPVGRGVRFSIPLLRRILGMQAPVVEFTPNDLQQLDARKLLLTLLSELGIGDGTPMPEPQSTESIARWLRLDLPRWLCDRLAEDQRRSPSRYPAWVVINAVVPENERLQWGENLKDLVGALAGVHDPGQNFVDIPQLRWLFLARSPAPLPVAAVERYDEDLGTQTDYAQEFAECLQAAWQAVGKEAVPEGFLKMMAEDTFRKNADALPRRQALALRVRELVLLAPPAAGG